MQTIPRKPRTRVLRDAELVAVYRAAEGLGYPFGHIVQLCIITGQRRSEIAWSRREYIKGDRCTLPGWLTKNKRQHRIPLNSFALKVIKSIPK